VTIARDPSAKAAETTSVASGPRWLRAFHRVAECVTDCVESPGFTERIGAADPHLQVPRLIAALIPGIVIRGRDVRREPYGEESHSAEEANDHDDCCWLKHRLVIGRRSHCLKHARPSICHLTRPFGFNRCARLNARRNNVPLLLDVASLAGPSPSPRKKGCGEPADGLGRRHSAGSPACPSRRFAELNVPMRGHL